MHVYKILRAEEWAALNAEGQTNGALIDVADGFIHLSTADQARETAAKHFAGQGGLILATLNADNLGDALRWEVSRGDALFPHLYAPLRLIDIVSHTALPLRDGAHVFPDGF